VARFVAAQLDASGAEVGRQAFTGTPHGFALVWGAALALVAGYTFAIATRRHGLALVLILATAGLLLLEFEALRSPVSGLAARTQHNVVGTFAGRPGGPTLVLGAHLDTTTHFGDHLTWRTWGFLQGPATALAVGLALFGLWRARRARPLARRVTVPLAILAAVPFAALFVCQTLGPWLRAPSPGALDNGGSVAALLRLAPMLGARPADAPTTVVLVFFEAEEERALGSRAYAKSLDPTAAVAAVNLELVGAGGALALVPEDGFVLRRWASPPWLLALVDEAAREALGHGLARRALPAGTLTDGRSFLARGIPATTLGGLGREGFVPRLHGPGDARERLDPVGIERAVRVLRALVARLDAEPGLVPRARVLGARRPGSSGRLARLRPSARAPRGAP
jgi:acetylornithine deacetylase/succinyl-diaminopimelate desuccinylase-like protein